MDDPIADIDKWKMAEGHDGVHLYQGVGQDSREASKERPESTLQPAKAPKPVLSKTQIMQGAGDASDDADSVNWNWNDAVPLARGGTDESSGGDYKGEAEPGSPWE